MKEHSAVNNMTPAELSAYFVKTKPNTKQYALIASFAGY